MESQSQEDQQQLAAMNLPRTAEESTAIMGTLMHIQELFYRLSEFKDGPNAGKVNQEQFKEILLASEQFDFTGQDVDLKTVDYMTLLDTDKDEQIGFFDFLQPILHVLPAEVVTAFTQDQRFKQDTFNDLRLVFEDCKQTVDGGIVQANVDTIRGKLIEKGVEQSKQLNRAFDQLLHLVRHKEGQPLLALDFYMGVLRLEKRTMFTFTSKLYQEEEVRLRGLLQSEPERFVPDFALKQAVATAIDDQMLQASDAKSLLRQMQSKLNEMEVRLSDYEDTSVNQISPGSLPQAQSQPKDLWMRFRRCMPSFMDVVLDTSATISDTSYLVMSSNVQKKVIQDLNTEIDQTRQFKNRYEKIVDDLAKANSEEQKKMTPQTIKVINKNLLKQRNDKQKQLNAQARKLRRSENTVRVQKQFIDGKISKSDLTTIIQKSEKEESEFNQIKLRKVKVEKIRQEAEQDKEENLNEPKSMKDLLAMFNGGGAKKDTQPLVKKVTVIEEGNVAPGKAFQKKQAEGQQQQQTKSGDRKSQVVAAQEQLSEEEEQLSDEQLSQASADEGEEDEEGIEEVPELTELTEEEVKQSEAEFGKTHAVQSFIQVMFESQLKRKFEEDQAKQQAGLKGFKATGNAMRDGFRRMIEKKMLEKVEAELAKKKEEEILFKQQMELQQQRRESQMQKEKSMLASEAEIKLKTAQEAREDAEVMAKTITVGCMIEAAAQTGMIQEGSGSSSQTQTNNAAAPGDVQSHDDPQAIFVKSNQMLVQAGQPALTAEQMHAFDLVWANPSAAKFGGMEGQALQHFSQRLASDPVFRAERKNCLRDLYFNRDKDQSGVLKGEEALAFIDEAYAAMTGQTEVKLDTQARQNLYNALQSLDPSYEGFNLDDFMRGMTSLAVWNKEGKTAPAFAHSNQMLAQTGQPQLSADQMRAFDLVWANSNAARFGGLQGESLHQFATQMVSNPGFKSEKRNCLRDLYVNRDTDESGILKGEQGLAFIDEAFAAMTGQTDVKLDPQARKDLYNAMQSLDPDYEGFNLDDFMRTVSSLAAWHQGGRPASLSQSEQQNMSNEERVRVMIDQGFSSTKAQLDKIRNEVEIARLEILAERQAIEAQKSELLYDREQLEEEKREHAKNGAKVVAATAGQALLVELEVKKRLKEERDREAYEREQKEKGGIDNDLRALATFNELRKRQAIDYDNVSADDALFDAMMGSMSLDKKKLLMRYKRLKQEVLKRDASFTNKVLRNYFCCITKVGPLWKKSEGLFGGWQQRFCVLSNCGLVYFKMDHMEKKGDLTPQGFKPLNDYVIQDVDEAETKKPHSFRIIFCRTAVITHPMTVSAPTAHDKKEWINAFRMHQVDTMEARSKIFERKLERDGLRVPRASILITNGMNAPLQQIQRQQARTMSHGEAIRPLSSDGSNDLLGGTMFDSSTKTPGSKAAALQKQMTMQPIQEEPDEVAHSLTTPIQVTDHSLLANKGVLQSEIVIFYFAGMGRADPIRQMFEYHGQRYKKIDIDPNYWAEKKAADEGGEFGGGLPQVMFEDENGVELELAQFGSIMRHFGMRYGYYDASSFEMSRYVDPIVETFGDLMNHLAKIIFAPNDADKMPLIFSYLEFVKKYHSMVESNLEHHGGCYAAGDQVTIADFVMASYIGNYLLNPAFVASQQAQAIVGETPNFEAYIQNVQNTFKYLKTRPTPGPF